MNGLKLAKTIISGFNKAKYQIKNYGNCQISKNTDEGIAQIKFISRDNPITLQYPIVTNEMIIDAIKNDEKINLDYCYIESFDYAFICDETEKNDLVIDGFSAVATFFEGVTDFSGAKFINANFQYAHFYKSTNFFKCKFNDAFVNFSNAHFFRKNIDFSESVFINSKVSFEFAIFRRKDFKICKASFEKSKMLFSNSTIFATNIKFYGISFNNNSSAPFNNVYATTTTVRFQKCTFTARENLTFKKVDTLEIMDCTVENYILMDSGENMADKLCFEGTRNLGRIYINWKNAKNGIARYGVSTDGTTQLTKDEYQSKARQMRMIKENFRAISEYENEDMAFVEYMRYKRKHAKNSINVATNWLVDIIGVYATKPTRVAICMVLTWLLFGVIFGITIIFGGLQAGGQALSYQNFFEGFYFSAITFLTIGYGDISPIVPLTKILAPIEGFIGLFLMSYFTVAVVRKTLR